MRNQCEASGLRVRANANGRGRCPLCGGGWRTLTKESRLRPHRRYFNRDLPEATIARLLNEAARAFEDEEN